MATSEREAVWQRVIQIPTRALFKRYLKQSKVDKGRATQVLHEYKRFLTLKALEADTEGTRVAASPSLNAMWQQHVLDTAAYTQCCTALCGSLLHHNPDAQEEEKHNVRCHRALQLYRKHFGEDPPTHTWDFGDIGPPPSLAEDADAPPAKKARAAAASTAIHVSVQAPALPLCAITARGGDSVLQLFNAFIAASGAQHLVAGRSAMPPTTRCAAACLPARTRAPHPRAAPVPERRPPRPPADAEAPVACPGCDATGAGSTMTRRRSPTRALRRAASCTSRRRASATRARSSR